MGIARTWIEKCNRHHDKCKRTDGSRHPPRRLIDVGLLDSNSIQLVVSLQDQVLYAALSHRWVTGDMPSWVTTTKNLEQRCDSMRLNSLPKSVRDAITYTRALGIQYLWIDSLCIIQDSAADWTEESAKMLNVFGNAAITLFADCAANDDRGFLGPRQSDKFYRRKGLDLRMRTSDGALLTVTLLERYSRYKFAPPAKTLDLFQSDIVSSILARRGWIFQEQIVSRRQLHFGKHQMYWICAEDCRAEDGTFLASGMPKWYRWSYKTPAIASLIKSKAPPFMTNSLVASRSSSQPEPAQFAAQRQRLRSSGDGASKAQHADWSMLIEDYTRRNLTRNGDRLPALSALAELFGKKYEDNFLVGCWTKSVQWDMTWCARPGVSSPPAESTSPRNNTPANLLAGKLTSKSENEVEQLASWPSWSWTSALGRVQYPHLKTSASPLQFAVEQVPTIRYSERSNEFTTTPNSWSPMLVTGFVLQASISQQPVSGKIYAPWDLSCSDVGQYCTQIDLNGERFGYMMPDRPLHVSPKKVLLLSAFVSEGFCRCCARITGRDKHFLVLEESDHSSKRCRRIGYGWNSLRSEVFGGRYGIGKEPEDHWAKAEYRTLSLI